MKKSLNTKIVIYVLSGITFLLSIVTIIAFLGVRKNYKFIDKSILDFFEAENYCSQFLAESLITSTSANKYVLTENSDFAYVFFEKLLNCKHDKLLEDLRKISEKYNFEDNSGLHNLSIALEIHHEILLSEIKAVKLVCAKNNIDITEIDANLAKDFSFKNYFLTDEELAFSPSKKMTVATEILFSDEYQKLLKSEEDFIDLAKDYIMINAKSLQEETSRGIYFSVLCLQISTIALILVTFLLCCLAYFFFIKPIDHLVYCIKTDKPMGNIRTKELGYLVATYTRINEIRTENNMFLKERAERDALTKLHNRQVFQQTAAILACENTKLILILIDIDTFKQINDTYGHDIGDKVIVKAASLMRDILGGDADTFRIGGDEFAIFVRNADTSYFDVLKQKIDEINSILLKGEGDIPKSSISAGIAYSKDGYTKELYNDADAALYKTKHNGRCGSSFFEDDLEEL